MKRTVCGACGYDDLEEFLDLGYSPIADAYETTPNETAPTYPLQLAICTGCRLVQLLEVLPQELLFGTGYSFYSSASAPLSAYHKEYAEQVLRLHGELAKRLTVEIGCNDGDFLRWFAQADCRVIGVDPATGPANVAIDRGLAVNLEPFTSELGDRLRDHYGPAGLIVANHVLAHVESVSDVLDGVGRLLADDGVAYIEVQYLPDLLVNNAFDLVYHEHRNFFSLTSLEHALERWGLHVIAATLTDRQGGSLRVAVARERVTNVSAERIRASESWLRGMGAYRGFQGRADRIRDRLHDVLRWVNEPVIGYGAPAKATTLLHFCALDHDVIDHVVDTTPAKQGRYMPGLGIPIVPSDDFDLDVGRTVLILAWNYAPQILRKHPDHVKRGGRWLIPIPAPMLL